MEIRKNDLIPLEITGYTAEGSGVGRYRDIAVFVPRTAVGDKITARVLKTAKTYAFGKIEELLQPSPARIDSDCVSFEQCGGCVFRHISYEEELHAKQQRVKDALVRIGGFADLNVQPILGAAQPNGYRNKAQLPIGMQNGSVVMGFYATHSHRIVDAETCCLQPAVFEKAAKVVRAWIQQSGIPVYNEQTGKGCFRHLYLRRGEITGELMVCLVMNANGFAGEDDLAKKLRAELPELKSFVLNVNRAQTNVILGKRCRTVWGKDSITDELCGLKFEISPLSFYQVNRTQAQRLYQLAAEYAGLTGKETLLDLYCGTGTIGLSMAHRAAHVIGVEVVEQAIENAHKNAQRNQIENAEFFCGDAADAAKILEQRGVKPDVVVLDPPRKGCTPELIQTVARMTPSRVVYVSCDPATLARDLRIFNELGYLTKVVTPVDMFPRTGHVETCVLMSRIKG